MHNNIEIHNNIGILKMHLINLNRKQIIKYMWQYSWHHYQNRKNNANNNWK